MKWVTKVPNKSKMTVSNFTFINFQEALWICAQVFLDRRSTSLAILQLGSHPIELGSSDESLVQHSLNLSLHIFRQIEEGVDTPGQFIAGYRRHPQSGFLCFGEKLRIPHRLVERRFDGGDSILRHSRRKHE